MQETRQSGVFPCPSPEQWQSKFTAAGCPDVSCVQCSVICIRIYCMTAVSVNQTALYSKFCRLDPVCIFFLQISFPLPYPLHLLGALAVPKQKTFPAQTLAVSECKCRSGLIYVARLISRRGEQDEGFGKAGELGLTYVFCFCRQPTSLWCQNLPSTTYTLMTFLSTLMP